MPLIPYPDIPSAPGVPVLSRKAGIVLAVADTLTGGMFGRYASQFNQPLWQILGPNGSAVLTPDSFLGMGFKNAAQVSQYPVEQGAFSSYNKVASPYDVFVVVTCNGQGVHTRAEFLAIIQAMQDTTDLFTLVTPDAVYPSCSLVNYDYQRNSHSGVGLLTVAMYFTEVRVGALTTYQSTARPDGANPVSNGQVQPLAPTPSDAALATGIK